MTLEECFARLQLSDLGVNLYSAVGKFEAILIGLALKDTNGVVSQAASKLCLERSTLYEKVKKYGLKVERPPTPANIASKQLQQL